MGKGNHAYRKDVKKPKKARLDSAGQAKQK
jgi:hypothetical protein